MAVCKVQFEDLFCRVTQDNIGFDDVYLRVDGVTIWTGRIANGQTLDLHNIPPYTFDSDRRGSVLVELREADSTDQDDSLGQHQVQPQHSRPLSFQEHGADYTLHLSATAT
jgi:hypothetical protein